MSIQVALTNTQQLPDDAAPELMANGMVNSLKKYRIEEVKNVLQDDEEEDTKSNR